MAPQATVASEVGARASFFEEAREQGKCAVTRQPGPYDPHHVIRQQDLRRLGLPRYDRRNALRLSILAHANHTAATRKVRTRELRDENIDYVLYAMGVWRGLAYLRRYYDDVTEPDPRLERIEREADG